MVAAAGRPAPAPVKVGREPPAEQNSAYQPRERVRRPPATPGACGLFLDMDPRGHAAGSATVRPDGLTPTDRTVYFRPMTAPARHDAPQADALHDRVLDAAEAVVVRQGIGNLTLDAVAAEAGLSKGGLLHHYPSKDRLIEAMVSRCANNWRACALEAVEETPHGPARVARAMLHHLDDAQAWTDQCQRSSSAVFAALVQNPQLIEPMRAVYGELRAKIAEDRLAPGVAEVVVAAMDGLWLYRVLGLAPVDQAMMDRIRGVLLQLLKAPQARLSPARRSVKKSTPTRPVARSRGGRR
ncbi:MAG: hypothetical protein HBSAPP03_04730 [Phycisphaerae bacterium]|nr:MAG: hypothetical protein HBSAPP03_04730 [Phycisphaerae bacterium]